jgi:hypothetical protein
LRRRAPFASLTNSRPAREWFRATPIIKYAAPVRALLASGVCTLGVGVAAAWIDVHDLVGAIPTPADPTTWGSALVLVAFVVVLCFTTDLLLSPEPDDFGGGAPAYVATGVGGALTLLWLTHLIDQAPRTWTISAWSAYAPPMLRLVLFAFAVTTLSRWMIMLHKKRAQAARARRPAPAKFSLFLRPFLLDPFLEDWSRPRLLESFGLQLNRRHGLEEGLSELVYAEAPLVAVGESVVGARKLHFTDAAWKGEVETLMDRAIVIFFIPGSSPGALWEAQRLTDPAAFNLHKTLWLMPANKHVGPAFKVAQAWNETRAKLAVFGVTAPEYTDGGGVFMAHEYRDDAGQRCVQLVQTPHTTSSVGQLIFALISPIEDIEPDLIETVRAVLEAPFGNPNLHYLDHGLDARRFAPASDRGRPGSAS